MISACFFEFPIGCIGLAVYSAVLVYVDWQISTIPPQVIDRNYKPVRGFGEEWALRQSVESIVTVYEMLQKPPATNTQSLLNCSVGLVNDTQSTPSAYEDNSKETPSKAHSVNNNLTSDISFQPATPEKVPTLHGTSKATRSSVSSDYICADSPMLPGPNSSTSSDHDSCFSANSSS